MAHRIVGQPIGRVDGVDKVSGVARYSADVTLPGLVWGKALRSPLPHARILRIDTSKARALPGVLAVLTAGDLPDILVGRRMFDMPLLARDRVRFIGEKVAVVAGGAPHLAAKSLPVDGAGEVGWSPASLAAPPPRSGGPPRGPRTAR